MLNVKCQMSNVKRGFTLIELLVVIAVIGLLSTLAIVALNTARAKARDAKRVADMRQFRQAMELFALDNVSSGYGVTGCTAVGNALSTCALTVQLPGIANLKDPSSATACDGTCSTNVPCNYAISTPPTSLTYAASFYLEGKTGDLNAGCRKVSPAGLQ